MPCGAKVFLAGFAVLIPCIAFQSDLDHIDRLHFAGCCIGVEDPRSPVLAWM